MYAVFVYMPYSCSSVCVCTHTCTFSKPLRLLYSLIIYEIVNFSFFTLYSLLLLSFFLYLKSVPIYVIVHVHAHVATCMPFPGHPSAADEAWHWHVGDFCFHVHVPLCLCAYMYTQLFVAKP